MKTSLSQLIFFLLAFMAPAQLRAASASDLLAKVNASGEFTCTSENGGQMCVSKDKKLNIIIPSGDVNVNNVVLYAHGLTGRCAGGLSGENYLKKDIPALGKSCAVAILPRRDSPSSPFPIDEYLKKFDSIFGESFDVSVGAHSAGGAAMSAGLARFCAGKGGRGKIAGWLDASYNSGDGNLLKNATQSCGKLKIHSYAVPGGTLALSQQHAKQVGGAMEANKVNEGHCDIPKAHIKTFLSKITCGPNQARDNPKDKRPPPEEPMPAPTPQIVYPTVPPGSNPPPASTITQSEPSPVPPAAYPVPIPNFGNASVAPKKPAVSANVKGELPKGKTPVDPSDITRSDGRRLPEGFTPGDHESAQYPVADGKKLTGASSASPYGPNSSSTSVLSSADPATPFPTKAGNQSKKADGAGSSGGADGNGKSGNDALTPFKASGTLSPPQPGIVGIGSNFAATIQSIQENEFTIPREPASQNDPATTDINSISLFARCHAAHERCVKGGCVVWGGR